MKNYQARDRAHQVIQSEQTLVHQPSEPLNCTIAAHVQGEADVLAETAPFTDSSPTPAAKDPASTSAATPQPTKRSRSAAKRKSAASFRRLWEANPDPYAATTQRLAAAAEQINRQAEQKHSQGKPLPIAPSERAAPTANNPTARCQSLRMHQGQSQVVPVDAAIAAEADSTHRIQALLTELDAAIASGSTLLSPPTPDAPESKPLKPTNTAATLQALANHAQANQGRSQLPLPSPWDVRPPEGIGAATPPESGALYSPTPPPMFAQPPLRRVNPLRATLRRTANRWSWRRLLQVPKTRFDRLSDAVLWVVIAVLLRVIGRLLLASYPSLAPAIALLMLAPAALAVYLAVCVPRVGMLSFYRLFLIMLGLLIGGKI